MIPLAAPARSSSIESLPPERFIETNEIQLYTSPWVSCTRAAGYFGPIARQMFLEYGSGEDREEACYKALTELLEGIRTHAHDLGANAVVGLEITFDPFAVHPKSGCSGLSLYAVGTAAKLEPLL
jgi:uncharacterized protein YbjQ (UPF0145 family)